MASKKGNSKKASAKKVADSVETDFSVISSHDAVKVVEAALTANPKHCASLAPGLEDGDLREALIARLRYGKIKLSDL